MAISVDPYADPTKPEKKARPNWKPGETWPGKMPTERELEAYAERGGNPQDLIPASLRKDPSNETYPQFREYTEKTGREVTPKEQLMCSIFDYLLDSPNNLTRNTPYHPKVKAVRMELDKRGWEPEVLKSIDAEYIDIMFGRYTEIFGKDKWEKGRQAIMQEMEEENPAPQAKGKKEKVKDGDTGKPADKGVSST